MVRKKYYVFGVGVLTLCIYFYYRADLAISENVLQKKTVAAKFNSVSENGTSDNSDAPSHAELEKLSRGAIAKCFFSGKSFDLISKIKVALTTLANERIGALEVSIDHENLRYYLSLPVKQLEQLMENNDAQAAYALAVVHRHNAFNARPKVLDADATNDSNGWAKHNCVGYGNTELDTSVSLFIKAYEMGVDKAAHDVAQQLSSCLGHGEDDNKVEAERIFEAAIWHAIDQRTNFLQLGEDLYGRVRFPRLPDFDRLSEAEKHYIIDEADKRIADFSNTRERYGIRRIVTLRDIAPLNSAFSEFAETCLAESKER